MVNVTQAVLCHKEWLSNAIIDARNGKNAEHVIIFVRLTILDTVPVMLKCMILQWSACLIKAA